MPWLPLAILLIVALTAAALALIIFPPAEAPVPTADSASSDEHTNPDEATDGEPAEDDSLPTPTSPEAPPEPAQPPGESGTSPAPDRPPLP